MPSFSQGVSSSILYPELTQRYESWELDWYHFRGTQMLTVNQVNPFAVREQHNARAVWTYKVLTMLTWLLNVLCSIYYTVGMPDDKACHGSIFYQNDTHTTPFFLNKVILSLYWCVHIPRFLQRIPLEKINIRPPKDTVEYLGGLRLSSGKGEAFWLRNRNAHPSQTIANFSRLALFLLQIAYMWHLFSNNTAHVQAAAGVGSHFIFNNLLQFAFVMLFVRGHFVWAEVILIVNFFNLSFLYFRHSTHPHLIHIPVVSGPLAWTFVALYWNGAIAVNAHGAVARILANVAIWGILVYGVFFLAIYKVRSTRLSQSQRCTISAGK